MEVRLRVIGSSPAWPNPGCAQSGYLVQDPGTLLLDCGPGVVGRLRQENALGVDAIAITHFHLDHWGDLVPWAWLWAYGAEEFARPELWIPPGGEAELGQFAHLWGNPGMFERAFVLHEYEASRPFETAGFTVEARRLRHFDLEAHGFRVRSPEGAVLAYSGDAAPSEELVELARGADLFLCEATLESADSEREPRGHLSAEEALAAADGPVLLTHRPAELPVPEGAQLAMDGLVVEIEPRAG
jgi:ribonuclease BN (tRNA processing enzyme)